MYNNLKQWINNINWRCKVEQLQELDNKEKILECALNLFYQKGYDAVGVQEIVTAVGITKPTLYYYYKSKYGLLESLLSEKCNRMNEQLREIGRASCRERVSSPV